MVNSKNQEYSDMCNEMNIDNISLSFVIVEKGNGINPNSFDTYSVNISNKPAFKEKLIGNIVDYIKWFSDKKCLAYDPLKHKDKTFEYLEGKYINEFSEFRRSFGTNPVTNYKDKITDFDFYVLSIKDDSGKDIHIIRKMNGYKKVNEFGTFARINGNKLTQIDDKVIGIDNSVDLIVYDDLIFILNYNSIKKLFNLKGSFQQQVTNILEPVKSSKVIDDYDKFERNIRSNERLMNRLISMKRKGISFDDPLSNRTDVQNTIKDFSLDVSYKNGKIIFDESPDKESVLNLISDYYYRTTQHKRKGIVDE